MKNNTFNIVLLAGDRGPQDALRQAARVPAKALVPVGGRAMILRVLDVLTHSTMIDQIVIVGPDEEAIAQLPELQEILSSGTTKTSHNHIGNAESAEKSVHWLAPAEGPSASAERGLTFLSSQANGSTSKRPTLVTTADHALLSRSALEAFLTQASRCDADIVAALVEKAAATAAMPGSKRTGLKFSDGTYCGCNLFAVMNPQGLRAIHFWQRIEHLRKKPLHLLSAIGWWQALKFRLGQLSLQHALEHLSQKTKAQAKAIILRQALTAVDVDSPQDWRLAVRWLQSHPDYDESRLTVKDVEVSQA